MMDGKVTFSRGCWICAAIILLFLILFCAGFRHFVLREHDKSEFQVELRDDVGTAVLRTSHDRTLIALPAELGAIGGGNYVWQLDVNMDSGREFHLKTPMPPLAIWELEGETFLVAGPEFDVFKVTSETELQKLDINEIGPLGTTPWNLPEGPKPWNLGPGESSWEYWNRRFEIRWCYLAMKNGVDENEFPDSIRQDNPMAVDRRGN
jgi:hypothetical protein